MFVLSEESVCDAVSDSDGLVSEGRRDAVKDTECDGSGGVQVREGVCDALFSGVIEMVPVFASREVERVDDTEDDTETDMVLLMVCVGVLTSVGVGVRMRERVCDGVGNVAVFAVTDACAE